MGKLLKEFKAFAVKGNVIDMAVGVMIGGAFGKIVTSVVNDLFMPILSTITGGVNTSGLFLLLGKPAEGQVIKTIEDAQAAGLATFNYGNFIQTVIDFLLIAVCIFAFVKLVSKFQKKPEPAPAPRLCPFCCQPIDKKATRCPHCTSELPEEKA